MNHREQRLAFIGVAAHKPIADINIPYHHIVCAGAMYNANKFLSSRCMLNVYRDNVGEHCMSDKNPIYNELTVYYWMWKRDINAKYIGICHYRRFFNFNDGERKTSNRPRISVASLGGLSKVAESSVHRLLLDDVDIFLCRKELDVMPGVKSIYENHRKMGLSYIIDILTDCIYDYSPDYEFDTRQYFSQPYKHMFNMFVMKKGLFEDYSLWLFSILEKYENEMKRRDLPLDRCCGMAGEHLLNIWTAHQVRLENKVEIKELQSVYVNCTDRNPSMKSRYNAHVKCLFDIMFPYGTRRRDAIKWTFFMKVKN